MLNNPFRPPDYAADLGRGPRLAAAIVLLPFTAFFTLCAAMSPLAAVGIVLSEGNWKLAGAVLGIGLAFGFVFGIPLCWINYRLFRGQRAANGMTILPIWLIRTFALTFLAPLGVAVVVMSSIEGYRRLVAGEPRKAVFAAGVGCIVVASLIPAFHAVIRLGRRSESLHVKPDDGRSDTARQTGPG